MSFLLENLLYTFCMLQGWPGHRGKQGIWLSLFPDRENTGNLGTTQGEFGQHREFSKFP